MLSSARAALAGSEQGAGYVDGVPRPVSFQSSTPGRPEAPRPFNICPTTLAQLSIALTATSECQLGMNITS